MYLSSNYQTNYNKNNAVPTFQIKCTGLKVNNIITNQSPFAKQAIPRPNVSNPSSRVANLGDRSAPPDPRPA